MATDMAEGMTANTTGKAISEMEGMEAEGNSVLVSGLLSGDETGDETGSARMLSSVAQLTDEARGYVEQSRAANTRRAYQSDWNDFCGWCKRHHYAPLPAAPEMIALYLTFLAQGLKPSTIQRRMASITQAHAAAGYVESPVKHPLVRSVWRGIRRDKGVAMEGKSPTLTADLRVMVDTMPENKLLSVRDRALLLIGFAGAMRRSELVGLDVADVMETGDGLVVNIRQSKTDQEGMGRKIGIPYGSHPQTCPVRSLRAWLAASGIEEGAIFRGVNRHGQISALRLTDQSVAKAVKRSLQAAGRNADKFAGHSLRAGLATQAAMSGASERSIQDQTGHKSLVILRRYIRDGSLFRENAAAKVGL